MILELINGYPSPYPQGLSEAEQEKISQDAPSVRLEVSGVVHFEWLHTITAEFKDREAYDKAEAATGWKAWDAPALILEAPTSPGEGYAHPAILANGKAYCGFILTPEGA